MKMILVLAVLSVLPLTGQEEAAEPKPASHGVWSITMILRPTGIDRPIQFVAYGGAYQRQSCMVKMPLLDARVQGWIADVNLEREAKSGELIIRSLRIDDAANPQVQPGQTEPHPRMVEILALHSIPFDFGEEIPLYKTKNLSLAMKVEKVK